jgi:tetrameric-type glycyl-tRNA synthetase beta subunit
MADTADLLVEIGTEELPPQALRRLSRAFADSLARRLGEQQLSFATVEPYATPRRLALRVRGLATAQPDQILVRKGPALAAAFGPDGTPTRAAEGFARSCGVAVAELDRDAEDPGGRLVFRQEQAGAATRDLVPALVEGALADLPIPKRMRWGDLPAEFVRPVHWVVLLLGPAVIDATVLGVRTGRVTRGHRFHHPEPIELADPDAYLPALRDRGRVEPDLERRREQVRELARQAAAEGGVRALIREDLLDEVAALCEWPVAVLGSFDPAFLAVPAEALIETMQKNQKYFPVVDGENRLQARFVAISNIASRDPAQVRRGNERVIRPRFQDAAFFWEQDLKRPLTQLQPALDAVVFEARLGSLGDKARRMGRIAALVAERIGLDPALAQRAAALAKCDLLTDMVGEFASLQGTMGRYYAQAAGEPECLAAAMEEQYLPRHAGDRLPETPCGQALAIADRLDSLVGIFAIGQRPTGVKDPYGLRRAALGVLRILIETPLALDLQELLAVTAATLADWVDAGAAATEVFGYMLERLQGYYGEQGIAADTVAAVTGLGLSVPADLDRRIRAVQAFRQLPEAAALAAANKRIRNLLRKTAGPVPDQVQAALFQDPAEQALAAALDQVAAATRSLTRAGEYARALSRLATLRPEVDRFFDGVMVLCEDPATRGNRLALIREVEALFSDVADLSLLQGTGT